MKMVSTLAESFDLLHSVCTEFLKTRLQKRFLMNSVTVQ